MTDLFVVLTIISALSFIVGGGVVFARHGQTRRRSGPEAGAEIMAGGDESASSTFAGKAVVVEGEAQVSIAGLAADWRAGRRQEALPFIAAIAGFVGLLVFGGLALLMVLPEKIIGGFIVAIGFYSLWLTLKDLRKR